MKRGQIWTLLRGGGQHRVLVVSNDEYNEVEELGVWAITVVREVPYPKRSGSFSTYREVRTWRRRVANSAGLPA